MMIIRMAKRKVMIVTIMVLLLCFSGVLWSLHHCLCLLGSIPWPRAPPVGPESHGSCWCTNACTLHHGCFHAMHKLCGEYLPCFFRILLFYAFISFTHFCI